MTRVKWETVWNPRQTYLKRVAVLAFWLLVWLPLLFPVAILLGVLFGMVIALHLMVLWVTDDPDVKRQASAAIAAAREYFLEMVVPCR